MVIIGYTLIVIQILKFRNSWIRNFKTRLFDEQAFHCFQEKMLNYQLRRCVIFFVIGDYKFRNSWFQKLVIRWAGLPLPLLPEDRVELPASRSHNLFCNWSNTNFVIHDFANRDFVISKIGYSMRRLSIAIASQGRCWITSFEVT